MAQANQQQSIWKVDSSPPIQSFTLANLRKLPQLENFSEEQIFEMEVVGNVLPFKANNYRPKHLHKKPMCINKHLFVLPISRMHSNISVK